MKTADQTFSTAFTCDDLPLPVIIHREDNGRIVKINKEAKRVFHIPARAPKAFRIDRIRPERLPELPVSRLKGFIDYGPIVHHTFKGVELTMIVLRKKTIVDGVNCFVDFLEEASEIRSVKQEIIQTSLDAFVSIDEDQVVLDWNASAEKIFGWKKKEAIGHKLVDLIIPPSHREQHLKGFKHHLKTGEATILNRLIEITALHKKGHEFPVELTISNVQEQGKRVFYSFIRDISERKKAEENLKASELALNRAQSIASIGSWEMYGNFNEVHWSDEFYRLHGLKPQSVKPSTKLRLSMTHPHDRAKLEKAIDEAVRLGKPYSIEKRTVLSSGKIRWMLSQGEATKDEVTGKRKVFGTLLDITERKENEERQRELNQSLHDFQGAIQKSSIVSRADKAGKITYVNDNFIKISGYSEKELIGRNHRIINSGYHPKSFWVQMWKTIANGKTWRAEVKNMAKDGSYYWVDTFIMPFLDEKRKVSEFLSIRNDITSRKQSEEALEESNNSLSETLTFGKMGSAELDLHTFQLRVSKELFQLLDVEASQTQVMPIQQFLETYVTPQYLQLIQQKIKEGMIGLDKSKRIVDVEFEMVTASGRKIWIDAKGIFKGTTALGILQDVTEKRKTANELLAKGKTITQMLDGITDGFFALDRELNFVLINPVFAALAKKTAEDMLGKNILELFPFMEGTELYVNYVEALRNGKSFSIETQGRIADEVFHVSGYPNADGLFIYFKDISQVKKAEKKLHDANELLRRLSANVPGMIYNFYLAEDGSGVFPFASMGAETLLGVSADDLMADANNLFNIIHPDDFPRVLQSIKAAFSSAQPWTCEFRIILTDGTIKWIAGASNPYVENDGRNFWYGFMNDVTDQKQISHKLENLANSIPNGFLYEYQISRDGTIYKLNQVSQGVEVLFEVNMAAALANVDSLFSKIHPEDLPRFSEVVEKYRKEPGKFEVDYRIVMEDGRIKWVRGIANVRIILNQVTLIEGIALDITHQKALEQEELISKVKLEQSENYLRAILNASTDSTVFTDREGRVRVANAMGLKRIQSMYNKPFVLGDYFEDTLPPRYREDFRSYFTRAMGGEVIEFERKVEVPGSDGSRWIHARYLPVSDKQNQVIGVSQNVTDITDRREAELALERSEHDLRAILNAATESTFYIDPDGKMRVANVKAHKKVKELFDKEIKIGEKFISLLPEALCDRFLMNFNKALAGEAVHLEGDFAFGEGKSIWLSLSYLPVKSGSGEVTGVSFNAADITERKITEQALKQSEERFKSLYHNTPAMLYSIDATGNLIRVSDYWLHKMGYTREEVLGKSVADFLTEESKQKALEIYLPEYQRSGKITNAEYQFITKDGQVLETLLSASSEFENGVPAKSMTVVTDISEMKKLEREVDKLGLIASRTSNAVILTDAHQRITWVNEGFERLTEYSFQEAVGKNPNFLQGAETDANTIQKMSSALSNGEGFREEVLNYSKSGKKYWLDIEVMPIRNNHKELVGFMAIESDITNLKRAVHEMIRSEQTLQAFMDFAPLVAFIKDLDGRYMFYNKTYQNFMKDKELRAGSTDYEIFDKDFADSCRQRDQLVATSGDVIQFEHTVGKQTFMEYKFPLRDMHGVMYSIGGISIDITERKQSEEALKQSEAYLKSVFENSDTAFVLMDLDLRILSFNHMAQQTIYSLLKVSIQVGDLALSFTPENRKEIILPLFKEALEGKTAEYESLFKLNDETEMWIHGRFFPVVNNGKVSGVIYAMNDITLRKMAEAEILQSRERLQVIGDNLPSVAIYQYEVRPGEFDGRYTYYSSGVMQITGISQEALLFNPSLFENQIHGDDRVVKKAKVIEALSMNTVYDQEYRFHHQEKGWRWIRNRSQFSRLADGRIIWNGLIIDITERKEAELELKESEGRFRAMADYAPVLVWMSAPDKLCNYFNKGWLDFTGRTIEEEMGNGWAAGVHPDDLNRCVDIYERNFDQRKRFQMEYRLRRHDGEYRWIVDHGVPRYLPDGEFVGYIGSCFDIHDLVETRQKLSDNELRLRTILETEPECVKILNLRGELLEMNPAGLNMIEAENFEQVKGHEMATLVHENYRASFTKLTREVFRGSSGILEFQMTSLKGTPRWLETHAVPMRDARGNINSLLGVTRDISHRKETENTLRESEERYRLLFDLNPVPTWIYDLNDFRFLRVNKAAMDHYGYSAAEFMNMSILDIRPEQERERVIDTVNFLRKSNEGLIQHPRYWKHKKKDNTLIDVEVLSTGFKYENKEARLVTVNDVTEKLRGENELIGALKDKDLLIKEIHHRVKNNLQLISSILYIRMAGMKHSEMKIFLEETRQKIRSIALIHERLLQTESVNQVDICDYLNKLILDLQMTTLSHEKKIQLHADIQPANMSLDMAINCGLILNELITNSAKHAFQDNNGGTIKVSLKQNGDKFEFVVEDDGIGLPDTIQLGSGGFGMQVLDVFVKQLKAYVEIKRNPGTTYKLIF